jgi:hypothetical protein
MRAAAARRIRASFSRAAASRLARSAAVSLLCRASLTAVLAARVISSAPFASSSARCAACSFRTAARRAGLSVSSAAGPPRGANAPTAAASDFARSDPAGFLVGAAFGVEAVTVLFGSFAGSGWALVVIEMDPAIASPRAEMPSAANPCESQPRRSSEAVSTAVA